MNSESAVGTKKKVFHICRDGRKTSFLCPNGTIFQQSNLICDWWFKVDCSNSSFHFTETSERVQFEENSGRKIPRNDDLRGTQIERSQKINRMKEISKFPEGENAAEISDGKIKNEKKNEICNSLYRLIFPCENSINIDLKTNSKNNTTSDEILENNSHYMNVFTAAPQIRIEFSYSNKFKEGSQTEQKLNDSIDSSEIQILSETKSYLDPSKQLERDYKNGMEIDLSNHKKTYMEIKTSQDYDNNNLQKIIPVTSQYITTQSFKSGKSFLGSTVGLTPLNQTAHEYVPHINSYVSDNKNDNGTRISLLIQASNNSSLTSTESLNETRLNAESFMEERKEENVTKNTFNPYETAFILPTHQSSTNPTPEKSTMKAIQSLYGSPLDAYTSSRIFIANPFILPETHINNSSNSNSYSEPPGRILSSSMRPQIFHNIPTNNNPRDVEKNLEGFENRIDSSSEKQFTPLFSDMTKREYDHLFNTKKSEQNTEMKDTLQTKNTTIQEKSAYNKKIKSKVRQLSRIFSQALSKYFENPSNFEESLHMIRPTEPPNYINITNFESELLNFSDDSMPNADKFYDYIFRREKLPDKSISNNLGTESEILSSADSKSFIHQLTNLNRNKKQRSFNKSNLPNDHWTTSSRATHLWKTAFAVDPLVVNREFKPSESSKTSQFIQRGDISHYDRPLPQSSHDNNFHNRLTVFQNSTTVPFPKHDTLKNSDNGNRIDDDQQHMSERMDSTLKNMNYDVEKNGNHNQRIVLLVIHKCNSKKTKDFSSNRVEEINDHNSMKSLSLDSKESEASHRDVRALQLLNSLYIIATKLAR